MEFLNFRIFFVIFCTAHISVANGDTCRRIPEFDEDLWKNLENVEQGGKSPVTVILTMRDHKILGSHPKILENLELELDPASFATREDRIQKVIGALRASTEETQRDLLDTLNNRTKDTGGDKLDIFPLWITNQMIVEGVDVPLLKELSNRPDVAKIEMDRIIGYFPKPENADSESESKVIELSNLDGDNPGNWTKGGNVQWGVERIGAPEAWRSKITGNGIVVAFIDSGVRGTHKLLAQNYRKQDGWFDPELRTSSPTDSHGHGTHTAGTAVGYGGIGVAFGAQWIACRIGGGVRGEIKESASKKCGQFVSCPSDPVNLRDCRGVPHIVSNSWGRDKNDKDKEKDNNSQYFDDIISTWRALGIIPVFSVGNNGKNGCGTVRSPGDNERVIGVGSTDYYDAISSFSSVGPSSNSKSYLKPEIVAPGSNIYSASSKSDSQLRSDSGTSMSSPHVSGAIALMLSKNPKLTFDQVKRQLQKGCERVVSSGRNCGNRNEQSYPNYVAGYGRINILKSL